MGNYSKKIALALVLLLTMSVFSILLPIDAYLIHAEAGNGILQKGDSGKDVRFLQKRLIKLGYMYAKTIDGIFGDELEEAVKSFQTASGIEATGIVDEETLKLLRSSKARKAEKYVVLKEGDSGEFVEKLQLRLIELDYLEGNADGNFGGKTKEAIAIFQGQVGLPNNGVADNATQRILFSNSAPKVKRYKKFNYKALARDPDIYMDDYYTLSGTVLQIVEDEQFDGTTAITMRIATKKGYDDVVMVEYHRQSGDSRILEDDKVIIYGQYKGIQNYESIFGQSVSIPYFLGEEVTLK